MTAEQRKRLGEILAAKGYVTEGQIAQLLSRAAASRRRIGEVLISEGYITEEILRSTLEDQRKQGGTR